MQNLLSSRRRNFSWLWGVIGIAFGGAFVWSASQSWFPVKLSFNLQLPKVNFISPEKKSETTEKTDSNISQGKYTAVYLDTNQVFYGRFDRQSDKYLSLTDAFYYQPGLDISTQGSIKIIKVGTELHKPTDGVNINRSHIVTVEQLSEESKVTQAILKYKAQ